MSENIQRIVEVYTGAYASGKSEISINRALDLHKDSTPIVLVDLDTVEPAYTLRPIKKKLETYGIKVITQENSFGLGETGNVLTAGQINCLLNPENLVIDVGYGAGGLDILEIITNIEKEKNLNIYIVINTAKPETNTVDDIVEYIKWTKGTTPYGWKKFAGIISNTHLGSDTAKEDILRGVDITLKASEIIKIPVFAVSMDEKFAGEFDQNINGIPVWLMKRFMPDAFW